MSPNSIGNPIPILEFDPSPRAIIEPELLHKKIEIPQYAVLCFFQDVLDPLIADGRARQIASADSEGGRRIVYQLEHQGRSFVTVHPRVGAPMAAIALEHLVALGAKKFVVCGGAGVISPGITVGHLVLPNAAVRDEGTSYHYLPAAREVSPDSQALSTVRGVLEKNRVPYLLGKTWTTDAPFRETAAKVELRRAEGCLTVEMEAAAFFAVARFRGVQLAQILYGGDDLTGADRWDPRAWNSHTVRERLFWLAAEACLAI